MDALQLEDPKSACFATATTIATATPATDRWTPSSLTTDPKNPGGSFDFSNSFMCISISSTRDSRVAGHEGPVLC